MTRHAPDDGNMAALADYEREQDGLRELEAGEDLCHSCNGVFEEGDLYHAGDDGAPTCAKCVMSGDLYYNKLRVLAREAAAVLACSHQTTSARRLSAKIQNLLDGE